MASGDAIREPVIETGLTLFRLGRWVQAQPLLEQTLSTGDARVAAALGICQALADPEEPAGRSRALNWLRKSEPAGWIDAAACQTLLELVEQGWSTAPPTRKMETLFNAARQTTNFAVWALIAQTYAFYDQRQQIKDLVIWRDAANGVDSSARDGFTLAVVEAKIECGMLDPGDVSLLDNLDVANCAPLAPQTARLWQHLLLSELSWWLQQYRRIPESLRLILDLPSVPLQDTYSAGQERRLKHLATLLGARIAIARRDSASAQDWLVRAGGFIENWENQYLAGMLAWLQTDLPRAQAYLEQSLTLNPFQSRVRFELQLLLNSRTGIRMPTGSTDLPPVHDITAATAAALCRGDERETARQVLEKLDQPEGPFSLRLAVPRAYWARIQQGWELRAHLAEIAGDWQQAQSQWRHARRLAPTEWSTSGSILVNRAHLLYLLGRALGQTRKIPQEPSARADFTRFQQELGSLRNISSLAGDALFYRAVAAEESVPDQAQADWSRLAFDASWAVATRRTCPERLLYVGDRLVRAGQFEDARKAYVRAGAIALASERRILCELVVSPLQADKLLQIARTIAANSSPSTRRLFLQFLCLLAFDAPDWQAAETVLNHARQALLDPRLERVGQALLTARSQEVLDKARDAWPGEMDLAQLPEEFRLGLELVFDPQLERALAGFRKLYGSDWMRWLPIIPQDLVGWELNRAAQRGDVSAMQMSLQTAEEYGLSVPEAWKSYTHALAAIHLALGGEFDSAEKSFRQACANAPHTGE